MKTRGQRLIDLTGQIFGRLTVLSVNRRDPRIRAYFWNCKCSCGNTTVAKGQALKMGHTQSCGCLGRERVTTHGDTRSRETKEYKAWKNMKIRCLDPDCPNYHRYGGRGIKICDRWINSFANFLSDMGRAPSTKHSIDRINVNGNYEPSNCKWSTKREQANNTGSNIFATGKGVRKTLAQWCVELNIKYSTAYGRIWRGGLSPEKALGL